MEEPHWKMKKIDLQEIKKIELNMLLEFKSICEKYKLRYYLCGGTLLGAIRHKGFIPWDDDIDILMPRPDFNILMDMTDIDLPSSIKITKWKNYSSPYPFIKIVDLRTCISEKYKAKDTLNYIWIDIFPIDGNPESKFKNFFFYKKIKLLKRLLLISISDTSKGTTRIRNVIKKIIYPFATKLGSHDLCRIMDRESSKYPFESSKYIGGVLWGYGPQERLSKEDFLKSTTVVFEGHEFPAPSNYDTYLHNLYGDYMKLPPVEKRVTHSFEAWWIDEKECNE